MEITAQDCQDLERALGLEWLETNGRGGFSSGTVAGANTRRYHALLLTARKPPSERFVFVNHLDEWLEVDGHTIPLSTNLYPNAIHPEGYQQCTGFTPDPWPTWTYDCNGTIVQREIFCVRNRDLVVLRWTIARKTKKTITLRLRPMLSGRDYHATHHMNEGLSPTATVTDGLVSWQPYEGYRRCRRSRTEPIAMTRRGFAPFGSRLSSNEGSTSKKIGGRPVSSPTSSTMEPQRLWSSPPSPSTQSMSRH